MERPIGVDCEGLREDTRKIGVALMIGGLIGAIVSNGQMTHYDGILLFSAGISIWSLGLLRKGEPS